ncbi:hypothetical protein [Aliarcobacter butzleri]|uniref:Uncharacterized protein n=2 Tax=Aliarcobacter butzleri TaxID=28197 RepID=A0AAW7PYT3_9BACT|nr:hypothetical protein [Aliarcobacter butzleri]KLD97630.1 hypothetical protein AA20_10400 [Aliarcobacter butzleri L348]MCG3666560.1 hypothetical protein [Aliarcobacter butzleri]MCG3695643.1 hypothetical protein [Aliarcobacter butzleri]MCT7600787.1 hypothetical protein [Aliarcobacter butzleri]MCT7606023.1 hypothetical protein [Aliarcobacter butzleri]
MLLPTKVLFELNVYRKSEKSYLKEYQGSSYFQNGFSIQYFGGEWEYNEIIGFLKFYISGNTQIRVEYKETNKKSKFKTRNKQFILNTDSFCTRQTSGNLTSQEIGNLIKDCIDDCGKRLKNRYIDTKFIDTTINSTDWKSIIF